MHIQVDIMSHIIVVTNNIIGMKQLETIGRLQDTAL